MDYEIKACLNEDVNLRNKYIEAKNNGADELELEHIINLIINNKNKYNELISIDVNGKKTSRHKIKKIEDGSYFALRHHTLWVGLSGLAIASIYFLASFVPELKTELAIMSALPAAVSVYDVGNIVKELIKRSKYKKECQKVIEEIENNNSEGMLKM